MFRVVRYQRVKIDIGIGGQFSKRAKRKGAVSERREEICFQLGAQCLRVRVAGMKGDRQDPAEQADDIALAALAVFAHAPDDSVADARSLSVFGQKGKIPEAFC